MMMEKIAREPHPLSPLLHYRCATRCYWFDRWADVSLAMERGKLFASSIVVLGDNIKKLSLKRGWRQG
jgi:hypothetical protein